MNNATRKLIQELVTKLDRLQSVIQDTDYEDMYLSGALGVIIGIGDGISEAQSEVQDMQAEEQDKYDNMSEGLQASANGEAILAAADALSNAESICDDVMREIGNAEEYLQKLKEDGTTGDPVPMDDHEALVEDVADEIQNVMDSLEEAAQ